MAKKSWSGITFNISSKLVDEKKGIEENACSHEENVNRKGKEYNYIHIYTTRLFYSTTDEAFV